MDNLSARIRKLVSLDAAGFEKFTKQLKENGYGHAVSKYGSVLCDKIDASDLERELEKAGL